LFTSSAEFFKLIFFISQGQNTIFGEGASAFFLGKICVILAYFGKRGLKFKEKQKALGNTNKAVKDLNSTPSFKFVLISKDREF
jgi:hypothetical protein